MSNAQRFWMRWKAFAHRAAVVQSNIILGAMYFLVLAPIALVRRPFSGTTAAAGGPVWRERAPAPRDLDSARRQF